MKSLDELPPELLSQIVTHLETARTLYYLSLACKRLRDYIERDGFRVFVQIRFPSIQTPPYWKDAVNALTTLSRAWDRKAFIARCIAPDTGPNGRSKHANKARSCHRRKVQTMGYQPVIDSYIDCYGPDWGSRKEVLAWGGGADLIVRVKGMGGKIERAYQASHVRGKKKELFDQHHHMTEWVMHREAGFVDGRDDITSINLLRPSQKHTDESEYIVVGRASGHLEVVKVSVTGSSSSKVAGLVSGKSLRSASVNSAAEPLVAACVADSTISLYSIKLDRSCLEPIGEISAIPPGQSGRTWSTQFLRHDRLAVGLGTFEDSLHVFSLGQNGISTASVRKFGFRDPSADSRLDKVGNEVGCTSTVYSIAPLGPSSIAGGAEGDLFLTGGYDGTVRLHDLRSPSPIVTSFSDLVDTFSAIYSLISFGRERFVAGGARHSILKVFDLRMPGGKLYYATQLGHCSSITSPSHSIKTSYKATSTHKYRVSKRPDWNVFLNVGCDHSQGRVSDSPIYSLSSPSSFSPSWYAGVEGQVVQVDMVSMMDQHHDPVFRHGPNKTADRDADVVRKWNPEDDALRLPAYEQQAGNPSLIKQQRVGNVRGFKDDWDERWQSSP